MMPSRKSRSVITITAKPMLMSVYTQAAIAAARAKATNAQERA